MRALSMRVVCLTVAVVAVAAGLYLAWAQANQEAAVRSKVLAEARTLNVEMQAVWDYIDTAQTAINTNADGSYDFKDVYCAVAGKGIARRFTMNSEGYVIRYVRENPRSSTDVPDEFEAVALRRFESGEASEHYEMTMFEGAPAFRYASALTIKLNCLECHGEPAGEKDVTGFIKEGMQMGDLAGAVSMVIPVEVYEAEARADMVRSLLFFVVLAIAIALVIGFALRRWVAAPMERANEQLQSENEEKSNFLAIMSHELRTPLSSIIAFTDIWEKSPRAKEPDEEKLVREIKDNSVALLNMVNNTIDVARLEAGRLEVQVDDVDVVDVLNAVFAVAEPLAMKQGVTLTKMIDRGVPVMRSDEEALRKIVLNLVGNALKFTDEGGSVSVDVRLGESERMVIIRVADTGIGIAKRDHEQVFRKFTQAGSQKTFGSAGSGLGLFLVKSLAEKLGGCVAVDSEPGRGSVFTVEVPVASAESTADDEG